MRKIKKLQSGGAGAGLATNANSPNMATFLRNQSGFDGSFLLGEAGKVANDFSKFQGNQRSEAARGLLTTGLDAAAPGAGTALNLTGKLYQGFTRDDKGRYKSKFAGIVENSNPINLISNLASGDFSGKKLKKQIEQQEASERFRKNLARQQSALAAQTQLIGQRANQGFFSYLLNKEEYYLTKLLIEERL